jgi:hypothetical protein
LAAQHQTHRTVSWRRTQRGRTGDARVVASRSRSCCHRRCSLRCCRCHPSSAVCGRCNKLASNTRLIHTRCKMESELRWD